MMSSGFRRIPALPRAFPHEDLPRQLYLIPTGILAGEFAAAAIISGQGWPIADGPLAFTAGAIVLRDTPLPWLAVASYPELIDWAEGEGEAVARYLGRLVRRIGGRRKVWGGRDDSPSRIISPKIMGIVNVTPDSFSDAGETQTHAAAIARGLALAEAGADLIDVGGESTRPGADPVSDEQETTRVLPVIRALAERGLTVSIDTRHARVMAAAVEAGARIINDVTALSGDPEALRVAAQSGAAVCLMHIGGGGDPRWMQHQPHYTCAPLDVYDALAERVAVCEAAGIERSRIAVDPGIGFGKTVEHNTQILGALTLYQGLGCEVLLGVSRKSFIGALSQREGARDRLAGTLATQSVALDAGVGVLRVHDVEEAVQALRVWRGIRLTAP